MKEEKKDDETMGGRRGKAPAVVRLTFGRSVSRRVAASPDLLKGIWGPLVSAGRVRPRRRSTAAGVSTQMMEERALGCGPGLWDEPKPTCGF